MAANELPEAGGVVFTKLFDASGNQYSITGRGATSSAAVDDLVDGINHAVIKYGWMSEAKYRSGKGSPAPPTPPSPTNAPPEPAGPPVQATDTSNQVPNARPTVAPDEASNKLVELVWDTIEFEMSKNGMVGKVKGGNFKKFGITAYAEAIEAAWNVKVDDLEPGTIWNRPTEGASIAVLELKKNGFPYNKVVKFQ